MRTTALIAAGCLVLASAAAAAPNYDLYIDHLPDDLVPVDQARPQYPAKGVRRGQEGWVRVNFIVTEAGQAIDPVIMDSVGGIGFEEATLEAVRQWTFDPPGEQLANVTAEVRFEIYRGRDLATSNFLRRYRRVVTHLVNEDIDEAREAVDKTAELGGWNLYESTMLWLMIGRVEGAEGNDVGKLEAYRRALAVSTHNSLDGNDRRELLHMMFELEMAQSQYAAAKKTLKSLKKVPGSKDDLAELADMVAELDARLAGDDPLVARGTVFSPAGSGNSSPLWSYAPTRRTFSFAAPDGNVERFEVRCERDRLEGPVEAGRAWTLPDNARNCQVLVFGDDGASFDFIEHIEKDSDDATAESAVASNDGLDR